jgi:hypothetical protein
MKNRHVVITYVLDSRTAPVDTITPKISSHLYPEVIGRDIFASIFSPLVDLIKIKLPGLQEVRRREGC